MAPPSILSCFDNTDRNSSSVTLLLSPFPSFSNCATPSVFSDHNYVFKDIDTSLKTPSDITNDGCFGFSPCDDSEVTTSDEDSLSGDSKVSDDLFQDVPLVSSEETPGSCDTDFLQGLDDIDFDFDDFELDRDVSVENNFQSFIDATLDDAMDGSFIEDETSCTQNNEGEDVYKKEFFFKHLGLQRTTPAQMSSPQNRSRKRKHEESESSISQNSHSLSSLRISFPETEVHPLTHHKLHINSPHNALQSVDTLASLSVPSKSCSCATSDWSRSILYSTAKSSDIVSVQTSPSTACGMSSQNMSSRPSSVYQSSLFHNDIYDRALSPSMILSEEAKECLEFSLLDKSEMDKDTEDLLQWLDSQANQTSGSAAVVCHRLTPECDSTTTDKQDEELEDILSSPCQQQSTCTNSLDMDAFTDLEAYVTEDPSPAMNQRKEENDRHHPSRPENNGRSMKSQPLPRLSILTDNSRDSINSDYYTYRKDAIKRDILKCVTNQTTTQNFNSKPDSWNYESPISPLSVSSFSSPLSPPYSPPSPSESSSSSSLPTSPVIFQHESMNSKNQDLLDLFSDENTAWCL